MYAIPSLEAVNEFKVVKCPTIKDFRKNSPLGFEAKGDFSGEEEVDLRGSTPIEFLENMNDFCRSEGEEDLPE